MRSASAEIHRPHHLPGASICSDVLLIAAHGAALRLLQLHTGLVSRDILYLHRGPPLPGQIMEQAGRDISTF